MKKYAAILMMSTALLAGCACKDPMGASCNQETKKVMATESKSYFAFDSSTLSSADKMELDKVVKRLKKHPDEKIRIEGYTDITGPAAYNLKLSEERAMSVANYLIGNGISADRIEVEGMGVAGSAKDNATAAERAANRKTVIHFRM